MAVEQHLSIGRNGSRIAQDLGCPSRTLLGQWNDELAPGMCKTDKSHKKSTDEERIAALLDSATTRTVKQAIEAHGIDKVTLYD